MGAAMAAIGILRALWGMLRACSSRYIQPNGKKNALKALPRLIFSVQNSTSPVTMPFTERHRLQPHGKFALCKFFHKASHLKSNRRVVGLIIDSGIDLRSIGESQMRSSALGGATL